MSQIFILFTVVFVFVASDQWNYEALGTDIWSEFYPLCDGQSQSPINILTACTIYQLFPSFVFTLDKNNKYHFIFKNNGRTIIGIMDQTYEQSNIQLSGGDLNGTFNLLNFHIHWGENYKCGSEHQINGVKYAGEIHFVYYNNQTLQTAVLGLLIQSYFDRNQRISDEWQQYFHIISTLKSENDSIKFHLNFTALMEENLGDFWRYEGSLTIPPCTENIIWTIFKQPIVVPESQLKILRNNIFIKNYRHTQPLYHRKIYRNFLNESISLVPDYRCCASNVIDYYKDSSFLFLLIFSSILIMLFFVFRKDRNINRRKKH